MQVTGGLAQALAPDVLRGIGPDAIGEFLAARRWFGAKGGVPRVARIADVIPFAWEDERFAFALLDVELEDGARRCYQLPLAVREAEMSQGQAPRAVLTTVDAGGVRGVLFDAVEDPGFRARLGDALARGGVFDGGGARLVVEPVPSDDRPPLGGTSRVIGAEQSNTSIVYGERAILKLFRRLEVGEHPDVEISRFLTTRTAFRNTPALYGVMRIEREGASSVAGMLSRYLPASRDGWTHALAQLQDYLRTPTDREPADAFAPEARRLGEVTRALHDALGSHDDDPAFAPEPVTAADVRRWTADTRRAIDESLALLAARAGRLDRSIAPMAKAIAGRGEAAKRRLDEIAGALEGEGEGKEERGRKLRHHGDYHLGQVLRTADGDWMIIDFEGEPARPLAARRARSSPARDVAGMLRSFAYAAATGASEVGGLGTNAAVETRSARWERDARAAFLAGYGMPAESPLIALFEMEKLFYELAYELNNRPEWVWIPLRGIARLF